MVIKTYLQITAICIVIFTQMLDTSIVNLALIKIAPDLGISVLNSAWIITAFGTGMVVSFPFGNALCKKYCIDTLFIVMCVIFMASSLACAIAFGEIDFILSRFIQGVSSGILIILCQLILFRIFGDEKRLLALALWSASISIAPIAGPLIGGLIVEYYSWRWLFLINLPLMLGCLFILSDTLTPTLKTNKKISINATTLLTFGFSIALIQYTLDFGERLGWLSNTRIQLAIIGAILGLIIFVILNQMKERQVFDFSVFSDINYRSAMTVMIVGNGLIFASLVVLPVWLQLNYGMPAIHAGLVVAVGSGVAGLLSPIIGKYLKKEGYYIAAIVSLLLTGLSFMMMSQYTLDSAFPQLAYARIVAGIGLVLFATPLAALSLSNIPTEGMTNANAISICLRIFSSNIFVAFGFIGLQHQQRIEQERFASNVDRQFVIEYLDAAFTHMPYISDIVATFAMRNLFFLSGVIFFGLFLILGYLKLQPMMTTIARRIKAKKENPGGSVIDASEKQENSCTTTARKIRT